MREFLETSEDERRRQVGGRGERTCSRGRGLQQLQDPALLVAGQGGQGQEDVQGGAGVQRVQLGEHGVVGDPSAPTQDAHGRERG